MSYFLRLLKRMGRISKRLFKTNNISKGNKQSIDLDFFTSHGIAPPPEDIRLFGRPIIRKFPDSFIRIGKNVTFTSDSETNLAGINHPVILATHSKDAEIIIEDNVGISGASINCVSKIIIKEGTLIGANVNIWDTVFHPIALKDRAKQTSILEALTAPITIGRNVWIGANSTILKGVTIGDNTVIGAMSLVNKDLPPNSLCAGVPAIKIKDLPPCSM